MPNPPNPFPPSHPQPIPQPTASQPPAFQAGAGGLKANPVLGTAGNQGLLPLLAFWVRELKQPEAFCFLPPPPPVTIQLPSNSWFGGLVVWWLPSIQTTI